MLTFSENPGSGQKQNGNAVRFPFVGGVGISGLADKNVTV